MKSLVAARGLLRRSSVPSVHGDCSNTTAIVLGWTGSNQKMLAPYAKLYDKRGFDTLTWTAPFYGLEYKENVENSRDLRGLMEELEPLLADPARSFLFHAMSMNGAWSIACLQAKYPHLNVLGRTRGIFFDSCPVLLGMGMAAVYPEILGHAFPHFSGSSDWVTKAKFNLWTYYMSLDIAAWYTKNWTLAKDKTDIRKTCIWRNLRDCRSLPRHLAFAYSTGDHVCRYPSIELFMSLQRDRGAVVDGLRLVGSAHVAHLQHRPEEYNRLLDTYLNRIFAEHGKRLPRLVVNG